MMSTSPVLDIISIGDIHLLVPKLTQMHGSHSIIQAERDEMVLKNIVIPIDHEASKLLWFWMHQLQWKNGRQFD